MGSELWPLSFNIFCTPFLCKFDRLTYLRKNTPKREEAPPHNNRQTCIYIAIWLKHFKNMAYNGLQKLHTVRADGMGHNTPYTAQCVVCKVRCHCIFYGPGIRYSDIFGAPGIRYSVIIKSWHCICYRTIMPLNWKQHHTLIYILSTLKPLMYSATGPRRS